MFRNLEAIRKILVTKPLWKRFATPAFKALNSDGGLMRCLSDKPNVADSDNVVDINVHDMAKGDEDFAREFTTTILSVPGVDSGPDAPPITAIDIDPWAEESEKDAKECKDTIDIGAEFDLEGREYPPIPENRSGEYKFKGIKVKLPNDMLQEGTYRYRLDKEDQFMADDIRVCRYDPC